MINNIGFGDSGSIWVFDRLRALLSRWTEIGWARPDVAPRHTVRGT
jgi:hypothetical protein